MRITITPDGGGAAIVIAFGDSGGIELHAPSNLNVEHSTMEQVAELFRSPEIKVYDRGNKRTFITFDVFSGVAANPNGENQIFAAAAALLDAGRFCIRGLIMIESVGPGSGSTGTKRYMRGIIKCRGDMTSAGTIKLSFSILGGALSTTAPPAYT